MTYRPVDLQVSVPKVQEAGMQQAQYQSRLAAEARLQEQAAAKRSEESRQRPQDVEFSGNMRTGRDGAGEGGSSPDSRKPSRQDSKEGGSAVEGVHPFKGKHVDLSL